jgi:hypothetical protein
MAREQQQAIGPRSGQALGVSFQLIENKQYYFSFAASAKDRRMQAREGF